MLQDYSQNWVKQMISLYFKRTQGGGEASSKFVQLAPQPPRSSPHKLNYQDNAIKTGTEHWRFTLFYSLSQNIGAGFTRLVYYSPPNFFVYSLM